MSLPATANDIITDALLRDGIYAPGETVADADAQRCLSILNDMMDGWSNESLACYEELEQTGLLVPGQSAYTIGPGGNFNLTRPIRIKYGPGAAYVQDSNGNNYGVDVYSRESWNLISNRTIQVQSDFPNVLFYDPQYPLGVLNFYPVPILSYSAFWDSYLQLTEFASIATPLSLPPGYKDALQKNLALEIWPDFKSGEPPQNLLRMAGLSKGIIKRANLRMQKAQYDPELVSKTVPTFNWYNYSYSR